MNPSRCPHCFTTDPPRPNGRCRACGLPSVSQSDATSYVLVTLRAGKVLPKRCLFCGSDTLRTKKITRTESTGCGRIVLGILLPFWFFLFLKPARKVVLRVPFCEVCAWSRKLKPTGVEFEVGTMTFRAHEDFARHLEG